MSNAFGRKLIVLISFLYFLSAVLALALPQDGQPFVEYDTELEAKHHHRTHKIPTLGQCRDAVTAPPQDGSLFFTGLRSNAEINVAKGYAESHGLTHVSKAYPDGFTNLYRYKAKPERLVQFQKDYMQAFAEESSGTAYVMMFDNTEPSPDSIFSTIELPALQNSAQVDKIVRLSYFTPPDDPSTSTDVIWARAPDALPYAPGRCRVHFTQYDVPEDGNAFTLEAQIFDGADNQIGMQTKIDGSRVVEVTSKLPNPVMITLDSPKKEASKGIIEFEYGPAMWNHENGRCDLGGFEDGNRDGDCWFDC